MSLPGSYARERVPRSSSSPSNSRTVSPGVQPTLAASRLGNVKRSRQALPKPAGSRRIRHEPFHDEPRLALCAERRQMPEGNTGPNSAPDVPRCDESLVDGSDARVTSLGSGEGRMSCRCDHWNGQPWPPITLATPDHGFIPPLKVVGAHRPNPSESGDDGRSLAAMFSAVLSG